MSFFNRFKKSDILSILACLLGLLLSVRTGSIWQDEGATYDIAGDGNNLKTMVQELENHVASFNRSNATAGTSIYFFLEFLWCGLFGFSEYAMRSSNFIFAVLYLFAAYKIIRFAGLPFWSLAVFALNPVFLYYMNEARPYAAVVALGLCCFYSLWRYYDSREIGDLLFFFVWFWMGCALHMMFLFMGAAYIVVALMHLKEHRLNLKQHIIACASAIPAFIPLAIFYFILFLHAQKAGASPGYPEPPLKCIATIMYFFAGLGGVGWSRNILRLKDLSVSPRIVIELSLSLFSLLFVFLYFLKRKLFKDKKILLPLLCFSSTLLLFILAHIVLKAKFWERHISFVLPIGIFILVCICVDMLDRRNARPVRVIAGLALAMQCLSGINIMLLDYYQKDDYKGAAAIARSLNPDHILFEGDKKTFAYYGVKGNYAEDIPEDMEISENVNISTVGRERLDSILAGIQGRTVLILCEKKDFDNCGIYRSLGEGGTKVHCFSVVEWNRQPQGAEQDRADETQLAGRQAPPAGSL